MKTSHKFATSPDILVTKEKLHCLTIATVLVAISSPEIINDILSFYLMLYSTYNKGKITKITVQL